MDTEKQFTAMPKLFIGMDIHKKKWYVHMRTDISDHKSMTFDAKPEALFNYVNSHFSDHEVHLVYESGCCGFWAARYFFNVGWQVTVVNPADIPRMNKQLYQKTDKLDCRNLSKQLQAGQLRGIFVPDEAQDELKSLLRQRAEITRNLRSIKSSIKGLLLYHGVEIPEEFDCTTWSKEFIAWLKGVKWRYSTGKRTMESKLRMYEYVEQEYRELANELRAYCRKYHQRDYYLLKSIPGVGGYLASAVLAEVGDLRRFRNEAHFASYVGIVPIIRNSGGTETVVNMTPRCRSLLRSYLIEAAWVAIRKDPTMQAYCRRHHGRNPKSIVVKVARKMLNRMLAVVKTETPYQPNYTLNNGRETKKTKTLKGRTTKQPL